MTNIFRRKAAFEARVTAAQVARDREHPTHKANGDELKFRDKVKGTPTFLASFTKGFYHDPKSGLIDNPQNFINFVKSIDSGDTAEIKALGTAANKMPKGVLWRAWESQSAGLSYDLEGPDSQAVTMPPAPAVGSDELIGEMGEVYWQSMLREVSFEAFDRNKSNASGIPTNQKVKDALGDLNALPWFSGSSNASLSDLEKSRWRGPISLQSLFRGQTKGDDIGPYISQFLLIGNIELGASKNLSDTAKNDQIKEGMIQYGAARIDQRVRNVENKNYMQLWSNWLVVQNGADFRGDEKYQGKPDYRFIITPRDLATYVHYDALYEAYLNACLIMMANGVSFDPGLPFLEPDTIDKQQGFAHFGGPQILSLVTEVATRALKAVRFQKFNIHRRLRPEALAGRIAKNGDINDGDVDHMRSELQAILKEVNAFNKTAVNQDPDLPRNGNYLLPMAFPEGSPMHPTYGAGHATVAGACVTILKAFFDCQQPFFPVLGKNNKEKAYIGEISGGQSRLKKVDVFDKDGSPAQLTIEGELNKLASNIAIGRDWAGVHYYSDYIESLRMGEKIALGILQEQKLTFGENFSMTVPLFDGGSVRI